MRADQILMLGVAGAGLFAGYQLLKSHPDGSQRVPTEDELLFLSDPLSFVEGRLYQGRLQLPSPENQPVAPFNTAGSLADLASSLNALGFSNDVQVFSTPPPFWPRTEPLSPSARWFQGRWIAPSMTLPRPDQITALWSLP